MGLLFVAVIIALLCKACQQLFSTLSGVHKKARAGLSKNPMPRNSPLHMPLCHMAYMIGNKKERARINAHIPRIDNMERAVP